MPSISYRILRFVLRRRGAKKLWKGPEVNTGLMRTLDVKNPPKRLYRGCSLETKEVLKTQVSILTPTSVQTEKVVLYFHGGGFVFGPIKEYWQAVSHIARQSQTPVWLIDYPKTPESQQDEVMENALAVYQLARESYDPSNILFMGDSAGGHILLTLCLLLRKKKIPLPGSLIPICPSVGPVDAEDPEVQAVNKRDFILDPGGLPNIGRWYFGEKLADPSMISPNKADLTGFPPIYCFVATDDILTPSIWKFIRKAEADGVAVKVYEGEGMCHIWVLFPVKEGKRARKEIAQIIQEA